MPYLAETFIAINFHKFTAFTKLIEQDNKNRYKLTVDHFDYPDLFETMYYVGPKSNIEFTIDINPKHNDIV